MLIFDIETGPQPDLELLRALPPLDTSPYMTYEFDESSVKFGNLKDPEKIAAKIQAAREAHDASMAGMPEAFNKARLKHFEDFKAAAPLSAAYGQVVAVGFYAPEKEQFAMLAKMDEAVIVDTSLRKISDCLLARRHVAGHNIFEFDLPFLIRRAWALNVEVPPNILIDPTSKWPKWHDKFLDTRKIWMMGNSGPGSKFADLAAAFGTGGKNVEGVDGATFWKVLETDPDLAMEYLRQDVMQPAEWLCRMVPSECPPF